MFGDGFTKIYQKDGKRSIFQLLYAEEEFFVAYDDEKASVVYHSFLCERF
ncbi:MAG: hypothetical protein WCK32_04765 [Chlorobiaceae bacterium]